MSSDLLQANFLMLVLAVMVGAAYAYVARNTSPYAPRVQDYLGTERPSAHDDPIGRSV